MRVSRFAPVLLPGLMIAHPGPVAGPAALPARPVIEAPAATAFHSRLTRAEPAADSTVRESPVRVRLWFSETCEVGLSSIKLLDAAGTDVPLGKPSATDDPRSIAAAVSAKLAPGRYQVVYKTAGHDGHAVRGEYWFAIAK